MADVKKFLNKKVIIIVSAVVVALLVALIPIIIMLSTPESPSVDTPDTGETFEGVYTLNMANSGASAVSSYDFKEGGKVTVTYNVGNGDVVTDYTYKIAIENGNKVIKLTPTDGGVVETLSFSYGKESLKYDVCEVCTYDEISDELTTCEDCDGAIKLVTRTRQYVSVNNGMYYKETVEE